MQKLNNLWGAGLILTLLFVSCKKEELQPQNITPSPNPVPSQPTTSSLKDSALLYTRDIYLWYNQIPQTFNSQSYSSLSDMMTAIRQYSIEPGFAAPVDRWSFATTKTYWDQASSGVAGDMGLTVFFRSETDLRVRQVEKASPAGLAGIRRGWRITAINGNSNITTTAANTIVQALYQSSSASVTFQKPDGSNQTITLNAAIYNEDPIILDSIYNVGGKKLGYFAFNSFLGDTSAVYNAFNSIFTRFASQGVSELVVDLRYNGGGYVTMAQRLSNWLAPFSANGQVMMKQTFNDKYSQYNETERFSKLGSLNLPRIFFIVGQGTASASELLINNLKPYTNVVLVGPSKTYGKPVGYFPIPVGDSYIFPVSFKSVNGAGDGSYYNGLALDISAADGLDQDWGSKTETAFSAALNYVSAVAGGKAPGSAGPIESPQIRQGNEVLDKNAFRGTIDPRKF